MTQEVTISVDLTFEVDDTIGLMSDSAILAEMPEGTSNVLGTPERALGFKVNAALLETFDPDSSIRLTSMRQKDVL